MLTDFPKLHCPFVRKTFKINRDDWKEHGKKLQIRSPELYLVQNKVNEGYEWVFDDPDTFVVEKLDGTNIKVEIKDKRIIFVQNRKNVIDMLSVKGATMQFGDGIFQSVSRGYISEEDGVYAGELIGPKLQDNPYEMTHHLFYPFDRTIRSLKYKSFGDYDRTFENWSSWFKEYLFSLFYSRLHQVKIPESKLAEGVIFYNLKRKAAGKTYMAKLRRNMFDWYYKDLIRIIDYSTE